MGYFTGGIISAQLPGKILEKSETSQSLIVVPKGERNIELNLYYILLTSAVFLVLMPLMAKEVMLHTVRFALVPSILISSMFFLFPPVFFMGMVSPMIVQCIILLPIPLSEERVEIKNSGKVAGNVYAISTLGGIISTFLLGFYIIPEFGLTRPAIIIGIFLGIIPFVKLIRLKIFMSLIFPLFIFFSLSSLKSPIINSDIKKLYSSEGLLEQLPR